MTCTVESWFSSLSQLFSAVIQSRAGEAQEDLKDEETQAQGLLSDTTLSQLQKDATTDARQSRRSVAYNHQVRTIWPSTQVDWQ